jgi:hypothetical protein
MMADFHRAGKVRKSLSNDRTQSSDRFSEFRITEILKTAYSGLD